MKGSKKVIQVLNDVLAGELVGINQYFLHSKMCKNWGFHRLAEENYKESIGEMKHASDLTERILFLEGVPNLQKLGTLHVGETVPEQLKADLGLEREAVRCGARTLDDVSRSCDGAGGDCGSCLARIERHLEGRFDHVQA